MLLHSLKHLKREMCVTYAVRGTYSPLTVPVVLGVMLHSNDAIQVFGWLYILD